MASNINGIGTTFYGERDYWPDGSYITTEWVIFLQIPLFPLRSFRLRHVVDINSGTSSETQYAIYEKTRPNLKQVATIYATLFSAVFLVYFGFKEMHWLAGLFGAAVAAVVPVLLVSVPFLVGYFLRIRARKKAGLISAKEHRKREAEQERAFVAATDMALCPLYQPSGHIGHALWFVPLAGGLCAVVLAGIYSWIDLNWRSYDILAILQTLIFAGVTGAVTGMLLRLARCRNLIVARILGIVVGIFTLYAAWVWFEFFIMKRLSPLPINDTRVWTRLFLNPSAVQKIAVGINEHGTFSWSHSSSHDKPEQVAGLMLSLVWCVEALVIIGISAAVAPMFVRNRLFCERCNVWAESWPTPVYLRPTGSGQAEKRLALGDISALGEFSFTDPKTNPRLSLNIQQCPRCAESAYSLDWLWEVQGRHGKETKTNALTAPRLLPPEHAAALRAAVEEGV